MKIAFLLQNFSIRGSEIAIYDYAMWNEILLNNQSIIFVPNSYRNHKHYTGELIHNEEVELKFRKIFPVYIFNSYEHLDQLLQDYNCNVLYHLKSGEKDVIYSFSIPYVVHCIFTCNEENKHGNVYASISPCLTFTDTNFGAPIVPHICLPLPQLDSSENTLRKELEIPDDAIVFGRYGGAETFDIEFVIEDIKNIVNSFPHIYFLFMNTNEFYNHRNIHYLPGTTDILKKSRFIHACDAMLYARKQGESFGLAIAEFTTLGKPIIAHQYPTEHKNHLDILENTVILYTKETLYNILTTFDSKKAQKPKNYAEIFNPRNVMAIFDKVFLSDNIYRKIFRIKILCNWTDSTQVHKSWHKLIGNYPVKFVEHNPDYWIIINKPPDGEYYDPKRTIVMGMEPDTFTNSRWHWYGDKKKFLYFLDEKYLNNLEWWLGLDQQQLLDNSSDKTRDNIISAIVSSQYTYPGHKLRIDFLKEAEKILPFHIYGWDNSFGFKNYCGSLIDKDGGLFPYKYSFVAENMSRQNYCTEKFTDAILAECLVFYWGCPNLDDFFDPLCYISLDLNDIQQSIQIIKQSIEDNEWEKRIDSIKKMKERILTRYSFIPRILGLLKVLNLDKRKVNLDSRRDKWETHVAECEKAQLQNVQRFSAIKGSDYDLTGEYIQNLFLFTRNFVGNNKNCGAIVGCALSHYTLWQEVVKNDRAMLIMEDDVTFQPQFVDRLAYFLAELETMPEWDVVFIGFHAHEVNLARNNLHPQYLTSITSPCDLMDFHFMASFGIDGAGEGLLGGGTFGYLISPRGANKLVKLISETRFIFPVDYEIIEAGLHHGSRLYVIPHQLLTSPKFLLDTMDSDIQMIKN